jgi:molybdate transport system substrate-binding protein
MPRRVLLIVSAILMALAAPVRAADKLTVFAAASLTETLDEVADAYAKTGHERPVISYAASSALARQIEAGAPAAIFVSADEPWADYLQTRGLLAAGTRRSILRNRLVLVAPKSQPLKLTIRQGFNLKGALAGGRLAIGDPESVPAGKYAMAALTSLGVWQAVEPLTVRADSVRSALRFVETGAARAGIVYATDAKASDKVVMVDTFPENSHPAITYPIARIARNDSPQAKAFYDFLSSKSAQAIYIRHGFGVIN